ncbi:MAG: hypothetical protein JXA11_15105 [Phycisphaerae bacterium]|nr:hypothetical protein [Phycisphaerae bacterium]
MSNLERKVHQPTRHEKNPLIGATGPWEELPTGPWEGVLFPVIQRDERTGKFRAWYAGACRYTLPSGVSARFPGCYAESNDGLTWVKPKLGLHSFNGSKDNNIIIPGGNIWGVIEEPDDPNPNRRYKAMVWHEPKYVPVEGYFIYTSPDGIRWTRETPLDKPVIRTVVGYKIDSGIGDTSSFRWDPMLGKYVGDVKLFPGKKFRIFGQIESDDFVNWTKPVVTIEPDKYDLPDTQIYQHRGFNYEGQWLGLARIYHEDLTSSFKQTNVELTSSRDGRTWQRVGTRGLGEGRQEFMSVTDDEIWDGNYHDPCPPIRVGDELWIFYRSVRLGKDKSVLQSYHIGLATLRLDGFVSLDAGDQPGTITTVPLVYNGEVLTVNAEIAENGYLKAELQDAAGNVLDGYRLSDCNKVTGDDLAARVAWKHHERLPQNAPQGLRLRFELKNAKLYSFRIQKSR